MAKKKLIDLYPYRLIVDDKPEFLLLKRAKGKIYQGQWRMIGGKVEKNETYWQAALRELSEETGLKPKKFWTIPGLNQFYEHGSDQILNIPAFAAEIDENEKIVLNSEHTQFVWLTIDEAVNSVPWPGQKQLLKLTYDILISNQILEDWLVQTN